jgi:ATP-dependent Clp protease ATP-binding subunit ClpC
VFERYTSRAKRVLFFARYEASQRGHGTIEPEHILLGQVREDKGEAKGVLVGLDIQRVVSDIERGLSHREAVSPTVEIPFSESAKRVLELAVREADALGHENIESDHLLLGILREGQSGAAMALNVAGASVQKMRIDVRSSCPEL